MTDIKTRLEGFLGKNINQICPNGFHAANLNHCAHFVGHAVGITSPFNCAQFTGGKKEASNIRVHETFGYCSKVGLWKDADLTRPQLCFVTRKDVVNVAKKEMKNIPQKHIGVFCDGHIYHYSNGKDKVIKQTPTEFLATFQAVYSGDQGLFFGYPSEDNITLNVKMNGPSSPPVGARVFELIGPNTKDWSARLKGESATFFVGRETMNASKGYFGLFFPPAAYYGPTYAGADYFDKIDHWAYLLEATGHCESQNRFNLVNTYDKAKFTFGFYQLAAHTPRDNLILLFRALCDLPEMAAYFPELKMVDGHLCRVDKVKGNTDLEEEFAVGGVKQLQFFMNYLNPRRKAMDPQEILHSARLIHWANTSKAMQAAQVQVAADILQKKMSDRYHPWFKLEGRSDLICLVVADIMHQGRGGSTVKTQIRQALATRKPLDALLEIGAKSYPERIKSLKAVMTRLQTAGKLGNRTYSAALNEFV
jgi:hypothetical protein